MPSFELGLTPWWALSGEGIAAWIESGNPQEDLEQSSLVMHSSVAQRM